MLLADKTFIVILVAGFLPAHALTLLLTWAVTSRLGKFRPWRTLGLSWPRTFGPWKSVGLAVLMFLIAMAIIYTFGQQETELERILRSSRNGRNFDAIVPQRRRPGRRKHLPRHFVFATQRVTGRRWLCDVNLLFAGLHVLQFGQLWSDLGDYAAQSCADGNRARTVGSCRVT